MDRQNPEFVRLANFLLRHAGELLRPEDADALLACQQSERDSSGVNPTWVIGAAALVQSARAEAIFHTALERETKDYTTASGLLAGALWRARGMAESDYLANWFYTRGDTASSMAQHPAVFLQEVEIAARPDTKQFFKLLVSDAHFDRCEEGAVEELLKFRNALHGANLISLGDICDARDGAQDRRMVLATWRNLLRRENGVPEKPMPAPQAQPGNLLARPLWSIALADPPTSIIPSDDGKHLALLTNGIVTLWRAETGELDWAIPSKPTAAAYAVAFADASAQLTVFRRSGPFGEQFNDWNLLTRQPGRELLLTGQPSSGVSEGIYQYDRAALRVAFSGVNNLACFDSRIGKVLWAQPTEGYVRPPIAISPDGVQFAVSGSAGRASGVRLYKGDSGALVRKLDQFSGWVGALAFSSKGDRLATVSTADGLDLWDTATGDLLRECPYRILGYREAGLAYSPDGKWLAVLGGSSRDGLNRIGVFRAETGVLEWETLTKTNDWPTTLAFGPGGRILYSGGRTLEAWSLR